MGRAFFQDAAVDIGVGGAAILLEDIEVTITLRAGGAAQVFNQSVGGAAHANPFITDITGDISFWADGGAYKIDIADTMPSPRISPRTIYWDSVPHEDVVQSALPGMIVSTVHRFAPDGWLICNGSAVSRAQYPALWDALRRDSVGALTGSSPYGNGDGSTTFNLPDLRARTPIGADLGLNLRPALAIAAQGGGETAVVAAGAVVTPHYTVFNWMVRH